MFKNREEAGKKLGQALADYKGGNPLVLAIPSGGVEIGYHVADFLEADFSIVIARKLPLPGNPEAGFGAIAEDGSWYLHPMAAKRVSEQQKAEITEAQKQEIQKRIETFRGGRPLPEIAGRRVILLDDGIAMGSTIRAGVECCRNKHASEVIIGAPVSGRDKAAELSEIADHVVILEQPFMFRAVADVYEEWYDVSEEEVLEILASWRDKAHDYRRG